MGDRYTLPPTRFSICVVSSVYAALSDMVCVSPALNAGPSAMRHAVLRSMSVDASGERGEGERGKGRDCA
jgi:hypothetical protein